MFKNHLRSKLAAIILVGPLVLSACISGADPKPKTASGLETSQTNPSELGKIDLSQLKYNFETQNRPVQVKSAPTDNLKVGFWNIANYSQSKIQKNKEGKLAPNLGLVRDYLLSDLILVEKLDLLIVVELNYSNNTGLKRISDLLNWKDANANYKQIFSYPAISNTPHLATGALAERYGFIYNANKLKFDTPTKQQSSPTLTTKGGQQSYNDVGNPNILLYKEDDASQNYYTRPPGGVMWTNLVTDQKFATIAAHFSAPGASANQKEKEYVNPKTSKVERGLGSNEAHEAINIPKVVNFFKAQLPLNSNLFFHADTNIKFNDNFVFNSSVEKNLTSLFSLTDKSKSPSTTLGHAIGRYANPYDKVFYQTNYKVDHPKVFDLYTLYAQGLEAINFPNLKTWNYDTLNYLYYCALRPNKTKKCNDHEWKQEKDQAKPLRALTSDHTFITYNLELTKN